MLSAKEKAGYGLGAFGKDLAYMLSANYILYYYQDILGVSAIAMGVIIMAARVFDAFNDPLMGVLVAKTRTRFGKFRPWLFAGTLLNAIVLYLLYTAPPALSGSGLVAYAAIVYVIWGVTYTMMDIPFWSMIPAFTRSGDEREGLTTLARSCAGVGDALITIIGVMAVAFLGQGNERAGFSRFALVIAAAFLIFIVITCLSVKEKSTVDVDAPSVKEMFRALVQNDQAMIVVISIVLINLSLYITSGLLIYFFKYDFGGVGWYESYTYFNMFGGAIQILSMMLFYPLLRKVTENVKIFYICIASAIIGYACLFGITFTSMKSVFILFVPGFFIFAANGVLQVLTTVFLANSVDYGELKNNRRDESVIFSMQTFVVKLASGIAAFVASICLSVNNLKSDEEITELEKSIDFSLQTDAASRLGLRLTMTVIPVIGLFVAIFYFRKKFILNEEKMNEITKQLNRA